MFWLYQRDCPVWNFRSIWFSMLWNDFENIRSENNEAAAVLTWTSAFSFPSTSHCSGTQISFKLFLLLMYVRRWAHEYILQCRKGCNYWKYCLTCLMNHLERWDLWVHLLDYILRVFFFIAKTRAELMEHLGTIFYKTRYHYHTWWLDLYTNLLLFKGLFLYDFITLHHLNKKIKLLIKLTK